MTRLTEGPRARVRPMGEIRKQLAGYFALGRSHRKLFRRAAFCLSLSWVAEKLLPFSWLVWTIGFNRSKGCDLSQAELRQLEHAVESVARRLPLRLVCLHKGLAACWMLQALGARPSLHYGVTVIPDGFGSHVWVELAGKPVIGHDIAASYMTLTIFPAGNSQ